MTSNHKALFCIICGLLMVLGAVGGIEQSIELFNYDGVRLMVLALLGLAMLAIGVSYTQDVFFSCQ